jgi:hypothetical protein
MLFPLTLGKAKADFKTVPLVFFINVFDEGLEVFSGFGGFSCHERVLMSISNTNYSINSRGVTKSIRFFKFF